MWILRSRRIFPPPRGFYFFDPKTNFGTRPGSTFDEVVEQVINNRRANPRFGLVTDWDGVCAQVDAFCCASCHNDPNYCVQVGSQSPAAQAAKKARSPSLFRSPAAGSNEGVIAAAGNYVRNTSAGIGLYLEWFGQSGPVVESQANRRAEVCLRCPQHVKGNILQRFNALAAHEIMQVMGILKSCSLHAQRESELQICQACDCPMAAKVWCPVGVILNHLKPEAKAALDPACWITEEAKSLESNPAPTIDPEPALATPT